MHEGLAKCSEFSRLLAIALLNWSDDEGYFMANPILIRGQVFPFEDDSKKVPRSLQELSSVGWIELGADNQNRSVGRVINFAKHQRVDKPKHSTIKDSWIFRDESENDLGIILDQSKEERKGKEGNKEQGKDTPLPPRGNRRRMSEAEKRRTKVEVNTPQMVKIGAWFGRKPETLWTLAESEALNQISPTDKEIDGMATYYDDLIPHEKDYRRRDLQTLLNNWPTELDRARQHYKATHP
jgi:hypothetical protein